MNGRSVGVVLIGRNEGDRLVRALDAVVREGLPAVYVDSGSTDDSVAEARGRGVGVVELDMTGGFSAARARHAGFEALLEGHRDLAFVQFIDGDCEIVDGWIEAARSALEAQADVAVVCGRRRERFPEQSIYNRNIDREWDTPVGEAAACGGDAMMRVAAYREAGGFDGSVRAGEEPELCRRIRQLGWRVLRIDRDMTWHDAAMMQFGQWWRREVRSGYGALAVYLRTGGTGARLFAAQVRRTWGWTVGWLALALALIGSGYVVAGSWVGAAVGVLFALSVQVAQWVRLAWRWRSPDVPVAVAWKLAGLSVLGKWVQWCGHLLYGRDRLVGGGHRLIEYKGSTGSVAVKLEDA